MLIKIRSILSDAFISICQIIVYLSFGWLFRLFFQADKQICKSINQIKKGSLLVSNHQSILDPFIIIFHLPLKNFLNIIPIRFPTKHYFMVRLPFLAFVGSYDIGVTNREKMIGLYRTREYLSNDKSIMLFPEGKISKDKDGGLQEFQQGITFLTDVARNVVFIRMEGFHRSLWLDFHGIERKLVFSEVCEFDERENLNVLRKHFENISI